MLTEHTRAVALHDHGVAADVCLVSRILLVIGGRDDKVAEHEHVLAEHEHVLVGLQTGSRARSRGRRA